MKPSPPPTPPTGPEKIAAGLLFLTAFLLPLKLANMVGVPEVTAIYSADPFILGIITWPPLLFPVFSGVVLLACLPLTRRTGGSGRSLNYAALWLLLLFTALLGIIHASTTDFVLIELSHLTGLAALAAAAGLLLDRRPEWRYPLLAAMTAAGILTTVLGIQQYFAGFRDTLEYMQSAQSYAGNQRDITAMIESHRIFSTFALPNSLGGYLILIAPPALYALWRGCGRVDPPGLTRALVCGPVALAMAFVLLGTGSRSSLMAAAGTVVLLAVLLPFPRAIRIGAGAAAVLALAAGGVYIYFSSRGIHSIEARIDYYAVGTKILLRHPLAGTGWGDFFHDYMLLKSLPHKEAPHTPHSFVMAFACQAGWAALLAAVAVLFYPLYRGVKTFRNRLGEAVNQEKLALLTGLLAWTLNALTDVNLQVPASAGTAILLAAVLLAPDRRENAAGPDAATKTPLPRRLVLAGGIVLLGLAAVTGGIMLGRMEYAYAQLSEACEPMPVPGATPRAASPEQVKSLLRRNAALMPWSPFPWATASRYMQMTGDLNAAEQFVREAIRRSPQRSAFYYRLAVIELQQGRTAESRANLEKARELFPRNPLYQRPITISDRVRE